MIGVPFALWSMESVAFGDVVPIPIFFVACSYTSPLVPRVKPPANVEVAVVDVPNIASAMMFPATESFSYGHVVPTPIR